MAVTDQQFQQLFNALNDLTRELKQGKNSFNPQGSGSSGTRTGRGGASNGVSAENNKDIAALANNLSELHKSFKSGGFTIADHFKNMVKNMSPLNNAFQKLEKSIEDAAETQSEAYINAAKRTLDFAKEVGGNAKELQRVSKEMGELTDAISDMVDNQEDYAKDQATFNKKLKRIQDARAKAEGAGGFTGGKSAVSGPLDKYLRRLSTNPNEKLSDRASVGVDNLKNAYNGVADTTKAFLKDISDTLKKATKDLQQSVETSLKSLGTAITADAKKIPNYISSRLKYGFESNEFIDAFRMGMGADELNQMRSANRDIINGLTGFGKTLEKDSTESLRIWSDNAKQVGLIGVEASQFTSDWMRTAFNTGRIYNTEMNRELTNQAQTVQQIFGGSIQDSAKMIQDYSTQVYNLSRFNKAQNAEQQAALQKELTARILYTKYLGYDVEYMKQQELMRHNQSFADIGDRIRQGIMAQVAGSSLKRDAGFTDAEISAKTAERLGGGANLTKEQRDAIQSYDMKLGQWKNRNEARNAAAARSGGLSGGISSMVGQIPGEAFLQRAGINLQGITEAETKAQAQRNARGNISFEDYIKFAQDSQKKQADSVSQFDLAVQEFAESVGGFSSLPGAALAGALGGAAFNVVSALVKRKAIGSVLQSVAGRGGAGLLGRIGLGGFGAGATGGAAAGTAGAGTAAAGGLTAGGIAAGTAGVAGAGLAGWGIGTGLSKWGQDAYYSDNKAYKAATQMINPLGYGATAISDYFSTKQSDNIESIMDRVSKTGKYTQDDVAALVKLKQVGNWWVSDEEDQADRQASIQQLDQIAKYAAIRKSNSNVADRPRSNAVATGIDLTNGIQRDANGNPIPAKQGNPLEDLVEIQREALDVAKDGNKAATERAERDEVLEDQRTKAQQQMDFVSDNVRRMF